MEIKEEGYHVFFQEDEKKVVLKGIMRLQNLKAYHPIKDIMKKAFGLLTEGQTLTLDFSDLEFLNSSGITNFSMFVLEAKKSGKSAFLHVIGTKKIGWQDKSLNNFKKLWSEVTVKIID